MIGLTDELPNRSSLPAAGEGSSRSWWSLAALMAALLFCLLPFLNKPMHIDDPLYIWIAQQIHVRWWDFLGAQINWYGTPMRMSEFMMNPPGISFYLAGAARVLGWSERALHAAMLLPALGATAGTYFLARRMCDRPGLATMVAIFSPVFIVSSTTIMSDVGMLCLFVWAIVAWVRGVASRKQWLLGIGASLILSAALTKYFAASLVPLLAVYLLVANRRMRWGLLWLLIPVVGLAGYQVYTHHLYGTGLLKNAVEYAASRRTNDPWSGRARWLSGLSFAGGCLLTAVPAATAVMIRNLRRAGSRGWLYLLGMIGLMIGLFWSDVPLIERFDGGQALSGIARVQLAIFAAGGLAIVAMALMELRQWRDADALLLSLGILGTFVFVVALNWTVSARTVLPMAPLIGIVIARQAGTHRFSRGAAWSVIALLPISLAVAHADEQLARSARDASEIIRQKAQGQIVWFQGHWGFQYYMQQWGARPLDARSTVCMPGEILVAPANNSNPYPVPAGAISEIGRLELWQPRWLGTLDLKLGAGFYSDISGPLPFAFGVGSADRYEVYRIEHTLRYEAAKKSK
jgi:4-amino-4-deoxy-L-arabinose transferase-like glycosyltransferase